MLHLFDSIRKQYPIGTLLFWESAEARPMLDHLGSGPVPSSVDFPATGGRAGGGPGNSGVVKLVCILRKGIHVYSGTFKVLPKAVEGVTYAMHEFKTKTIPYVDPNTPDEPSERRRWPTQPTCDSATLRWWHKGAVGQDARGAPGA